MRDGLRLAGMMVAVVIVASIRSEPRPAEPTETSWPGDSIHHVDVAIETADGRRTTLAETGGRVRLVTMFYARCPMVCPLTIETLRGIDRELRPEEHSRLRVLLLTLDPENDTPAALREVATERRIDAERWMLGRASPGDTRKLAATLGIEYRKLDTGDFDHSSVIVLLSPQGRVLARTARIGKPDVAFVAAVRDALAAARG